MSALQDALQDALKTLERMEWDAAACAMQRDELRDRLDRIRAATEAEADLAGLAAFRGYLLAETEPGWLHVPGYPGT